MPFMIKMPKLSPTMEEGVIAKWRKKEGEFIEAGEVFLEITTDKATVEHSALDEGFLRKILIPEGKKALINQPIAIFTADINESIADFTLPKEEKPLQTGIEETKESPEEKSEMVSSPRKEMAFQPSPPLTHYSFEESSDFASPLAKRLASEKGLDLLSVKGSGPGGRVTSEDLQYALPKAVVSFGKESPPTILPGTYEESEPTPMRKAIGKRLQASKSSIPHFYVAIKIDASPLVRLREEIKKLNLGQITFNDMIIRGSALALRKNPALNVGYNNVTGNLINFKTIDISIAVTIEGGLITPIIRHADYKNLGEIAVEMRKLSDKAKLGKLKEEEYLGGSFCISNLGMYGVSEFIAVINPPQAAILAIGAINDEPIVKEGSVVAGKTCTLTLSCDHRVVDGTAAALFLKTLKEILESPIALVI